MPRIPSVADYGVSSGPKAGRGVSGVNAGAAEGAQVRAAMQAANSAGQLMGVAEKMLAAEDRIRSREDAIERTRALGEYEQKAMTELRRLQTEDDISKVATTNKYGTFLSDSMKEMVEGHGGTQESRLALAERLEAVRFGMVGQAANLATQAQTKLMDKAFDGRLSGHASAVAANPASLTQRMIALQKDIEDMAPGLTPEQEANYISLGNKQLALSAINSYVARGSAKGARELLDSTPGLREMMSPEEQRRIDGALISIETKADEMRNAGLRKVEEAEQIIGSRLSMAQRMKLAGLADADKDKSPAAKITELENALGPLSPEQKAKALGVYIEQKGINVSDVAGMRKEFTNQSGDFIKVRDAYNKIEATARNPSPAGDMALIFNYMKMLDPGSTVREGEYATAQNAGSVPDRVWAQYNKAVAGESLAPPQRADFLKQSKNLYTSQLKTQKQLEEVYRGHARRAGFNPDDVVSDLAGGDPASVNGPATAPVIQYDMNGKRVGAAK
jgi:hypothetical protein